MYAGLTDVLNNVDVISKRLEGDSNYCSGEFGEDLRRQGEVKVACLNGVTLEEDLYY